MGSPKRSLFRSAALFAVALLPLLAGAAEPKRNLAVSKPADTAHAKEQRVALVIGNSAYKVSPLKNPANDAEDIAKALRGLGFQVTLKQNQGRDGMAQAIRAFGNQLKQGGTGLFYYAGHGMQVKGKNFLIPVDANIESEDEVPYRSIDANELLAKMEFARNRVNLVILDACRNNPFGRSFRSASQGLAQMDAPVGTLVAFATAPGSVAADGTGRNGLYTQHLLASMNQPGLKIEDVFKRVRQGVRKSSGDKQVPWENTSLEGDFYFKPGAASATADPAAIELVYWDSIKDSQSADDYKAYLKKYPNGLFADIAKRRALSPPKPATSAVVSIAPTAATKPKPEPAAVASTPWTDPVTGMEFVWIPKGCFQMGSPDYEKDRRSNERRHEVCVDGYWMGKYEVTNSQYKKFRPDHNADDKLPVVNVSWQDAMHFAQWLSEKSGKKIRLPTEAEWEYAARAGTSSAYFWGDSWDAHHNFTSTDSKKPVGSHQPNAFGLYDMLGNVWERTASPYDEAYTGGEKRVATKDEGGYRAFRGGSWTDFPNLVRSAHRGRDWPVDRRVDAGFRLARTP